MLQESLDETEIQEVATAASLAAEQAHQSMVASRAASSPATRSLKSNAMASAEEESCAACVIA